ncbi:hypothetical protein Peur_060377 [Populus x canadensis]
MLDLVEISLNQYCIQYRRLDGTLTLSSRDWTVKDLNTDPKVTVMLMSLTAGILGLNMVAACHEILLDLWWNPTTEDQAVDRAHRIAQKNGCICIWRRSKWGFSYSSYCGRSRSGGSRTPPQFIHFASHCHLFLTQLGKESKNFEQLGSQEETNGCTCEHLPIL